MSAHDRVLLDDSALVRSSVVANNAMNRERQLDGVNSYTRELGFNPLELLTAGLGETPGDRPNEVAWLDLCCGSGRAVIQAATALRRAGRGDRAAIVGVDLVDGFAAATGPGLELVSASATDWQPDRAFDLITCVHGLHYVGDKLGLLARAAGWLTDTGLLIADLDLSSIRGQDGRPAGRRLGAHLREAGFTYNSRRHTISCTGRRTPRLPYRYLGADNQVGANYTGQPAVHSHYRLDP